MQGRQIETSQGWSNRIFRSRPCDVGGERPQEVLGTNIFWLGKLLNFDVFTKYAWVKLLKDKNGKLGINAFIKIVNESNRKPNKL